MNTVGSSGASPGCGGVLEHLSTTLIDFGRLGCIRDMTTTEQAKRITLSTVEAPADAQKRNRKKVAKACHDDTCLLCSSPVDSSKALWVHLTTAGELVAKDEELTEGESSQGFFPVGKECAKHIPANFRHEAP